jgi:hypothetical protein
MDQMDQGALVVVWGQAVRGREQQALEVFGEALAYYGRLQAAGEITSFEPVALEPSGGDLAGFLIIRGEAARLNRLRMSEEFLRLNSRSLHIVDHFGVHTAYLGDALQRLYADWGAQAAELLKPQRPAAAMPAYTPA